MIDAYDFLETVQKSHKDAEPGVRLATIDSAYSTGNPKVQFDGEDTVTTKEYVCVDSYSPRANDRVVMHRIGHNYVIVGSVEQATEFYVDKDIVTTGSISGNLDAADLVTGIVPDARIQGDYTGLGNITVSGTAKVGGTITAGDGSNPIFIETADSVGGNKLIVRTATNPPDGEPIFEVRSSGQAVRFAVDHAGKTFVQDDLEVNGQALASARSETSPSYGFSTATDTGLYLEAGGVPNVSMDGQRVFHMSTSVVTGLGDNTKILGNSSNRWKSVWAVDGTINTSDMSEKDEIADSDLGLEFVNNLRARRWRWNGRNRPHYGLFAQEVKQAMDRAGVDFAGYIDPAHDWQYDEDDPQVSGEQAGPLGLRYHEFIGPLVKAVQELSARVEELEAANA